MNISLLIIITWHLYCALNMRSKLKGAGHYTSAKRMTSILRHIAAAFSPARQGTILNSYWVIGIATNTVNTSATNAVNTSMVLNCALVTGCSLTSYPGHVTYSKNHVLVIYGEGVGKYIYLLSQGLKIACSWPSTLGVSPGSVSSNSVHNYCKSWTR